MSESIDFDLDKNNIRLKEMKPQEMIEWGYKEFASKFAITTSFGIQSSVLLHMVYKTSLQKKIKIEQLRRETS